MGLASLIEKFDTLKEEIDLIIEKAIEINDDSINTACHQLLSEQTISNAVDLITYSFQYGVLLCELNDKLNALDKLKNKVQKQASDIKDASYFACLYHSILLDIKKNDLVDKKLINLKYNINNKEPIDIHIKNTLLDLLTETPELTTNELIDNSKELKEIIKTSFINEKIDNYKKTLAFDKRMTWAIYSKFIIIHKEIEEIEDNLCEYFNILDKTMEDFAALYCNSDSTFKEKLTQALNENQSLKEFIAPWLTEENNNYSKIKSPLTIALEIIKNSISTTTDTINNNNSLSLSLSNRY